MTMNVLHNKQRKSGETGINSVNMVKISHFAPPLPPSASFSLRFSLVETF